MPPLAVTLGLLTTWGSGALKACPLALQLALFPAAGVGVRPGPQGQHDADRGGPSGATTQLVPVLLHNAHVSHTRLLLEGATALARIRFFRDDLEKVLRRKLAPEPASRAAVQSYLARTFLLSADGVALATEVLDEGADTDEDQPIWWVLVQWKAARPITQLGVRAHVLFDQFTDQQNLVVVSHQPGDERRSLHFQPGDRAEQVIRFSRP